MLRPFQVNVGSYLALNQDILPTAKVHELCSCIEAVSGERAEDQVLLTSDGRQMDHRELVGSYSVGTEDKPLFVFYRSYISTAEPPSTLSRLPQRGNLHQQLEILKQRPSPALFQHQVALSKHLCEYCVELGRVCEVVTEEYGLQLRGWKTVLSNCSNLTGMFQKHHQLFQRAVEKFREDRPCNLELLQQFPQRVSLLQQLPIPSSLHKSSPSSLYDWISTHDEKNSLMDLSNECKKVLDKVESERLEAALGSADEIKNKSAEVFDAENSSLEAMGEKIKLRGAEVKGIMETITGLSKNIKTTSDKAFRSGDAKTIAVLAESHQKSLQLMADSCAQLEAITVGAEAGKRELTRHIHARLKLVMQLQKKVADSNSQLVLLHEHIKLARKRFEILEQVCSTPHVLGEVFNEVCRRRSYNSTLEKVMEETVSRLQRAREEEKRLRRSFHSTHGVHFVTTLFPELQDRVPDITFHSPKSLSKTPDDNFEAMCSLLPQDMRPSTQMASSVQLLRSPNLVASELPLSPQAQPDAVATPEDSPGNSFKLIKEESAEPSKSPSGSAEGLEEGERDSEKLKERLGQLELSNVELTSRLHKSQQALESLQGRLAEKETAGSTTLQKLKESEELVAELQGRLVEKETAGSTTLQKLKESEELVAELQDRLAEKETAGSTTLQKLKESEELVAKLQGRLAEKETAGSTTLQKLKESEELVAELQGRLAEIEASRETLETAQLSRSQRVAELEEKNREVAGKLAGTSRELQAMNQLYSQLTVENELSLKEGRETRELMEQLRSDHAQAAKKAEEDMAELRTLLAQQGASHEKEVATLKQLLSKSSLEHQELMESSERLQASKSQLEAKSAELQSSWDLQRQSLEDQLVKYQQEQNLQRETLNKHSSVTKELSAARSELAERSKSLETCRAELRVLQDERARTLEEMAAVSAELGLQQQRSQQAQATMNSHRAQLEALQAKRKELLLRLEERDKEKADMASQLERSRHLVSTKEEELVALKAKHKLEREKAVAAEDKARRLENDLNQKQPRIEDLESKLKSAKERISELEVGLSRRKEASLCEQQAGQQVQSLREEKDRLETRVQEVTAKLQKTVREGEEWSRERDGYIRQCMELEREVRELRRDAGGQDTPPSSGPSSSPASSPATKKQAIQRMSSSTSAMGPDAATPAASTAELPNRVAIHSLQVGQVALFMCDQYGNYLALSVDSKTYYLDSDSVKNLRDLATRLPKLHLKRKLLIGKITGRLYMEVRKENNRLKVPVGSRLYKLQAEEVVV